MATSARPIRTEFAGDPVDALAAIERARLEVTFAEGIVWLRGRRIAEHTHSDLWQFDLFKGRCSITIEGERRDSDEWAVMLLPAGTRHAFVHPGDASLKGLSFKFRSVEGALPALPVIYMAGGEAAFRQRLENRLTEILEEWQLDLPGREYLLASLASLAVLDLVRQWRLYTSLDVQSGPLQHACRYMAVNYTQPLSIAGVAKEVGVRPERLCRLFRRHMGTTPTRYLLELRLKQAELLLQSGHRVSHCAELTGFQSLHYFSRAFRQRHGLSPVAWLKHVSASRDRATREAAIAAGRADALNLRDIGGG